MTSLSESSANVPIGDASGASLSHTDGHQVVSFQIQVNTNYGEEVFVCGGHEKLGNWIPANSLKLSTSSNVYPQWVGRLILDQALPGDVARSKRDDGMMFVGRATKGCCVSL